MQLPPLGVSSRHALPLRHPPHCTCFSQCRGARECEAAVAAIAIAIAMSLSTVAKRKPSVSRDLSPKRRRRSVDPADHDADPPSLLQLREDVLRVGGKVFAFREKGVSSFARPHEQPVRPRPVTIQGSPESRIEKEGLRQVLKERLSVANEMLPTLVAELAIWNSKIQQAVDVMRKGSRLAVLDDEGEGI